MALAIATRITVGEYPSRTLIDLIQRRGLWKTPTPSVNLAGPMIIVLLRPYQDSTDSIHWLWTVAKTVFVEGPDMEMSDCDVAGYIRQTILGWSCHILSCGLCTSRKYGFYLPLHLSDSTNQNKTIVVLLILFAWIVHVHGTDNCRTIPGPTVRV